MLKENIKLNKELLMCKLRWKWLEGTSVRRRIIKITTIEDV